MHIYCCFICDIISFTTITDGFSYVIIFIYNLAANLALDN